MNAALWNLLLWGFSLIVLLYAAKTIQAPLLIRFIIVVLPPLIAVGLVFAMKRDTSDLFGFPQSGISFLVIDVLLFLRYNRQPR